jgi:biotin operon repressor
MLAYLYEVRNPNTNTANVTQDELAERLYISRATVNKIIKNLRDAGYVRFDANHVGRYILADKSITVVETFKQLENKKQ